MKCETCIHIIVCKHKGEMFSNPNLNPYTFANNDENARKAINIMFSVFDDCKYYEVKKQ